MREGEGQTGKGHLLLIFCDGVITLKCAVRMVCFLCVFVCNVDYR